MDRIRKEVLRATKLRSLTFRPKALRLAVDFLGDQQREGFDFASDFSTFLTAATKHRAPPLSAPTAALRPEHDPPNPSSCPFLMAPCVGSERHRDRRWDG